MAKVQLQKSGSYTIAIPKNILIMLGADKGDSLYFSITENEEIKVVKIKEEQK